MLSLDLNLTYKCNFRCDYCFEEKNETIEDMSSDTIIWLAEKVLNDKRFERWEDNKLKLIYWGGEPSLKMDTINDVANYFKNDSRVYHYTYTNGYIIEDLIKLRKENERFDIQISYDGWDIHNKRRRSKDGKSTADIVRSNIIKCIDENIKICLKPVLPIEDLNFLESSYLDYLDLDKYSRKKGNPIIREYFPSFPIVREIDILPFTFEEKIDIHKQLMRIKEHEKEYYKEHGRFLFCWFNKENKGTGKKSCGLGSTLFGVDIDGSVYVCHGAFYSIYKKDHYVCHITDKTLMQSLDQCKRYFSGMNFKKRPQECNECHTKKCSVCSIIQHQISKKDGYMERLKDYAIQPKLCFLYKTSTDISNQILKEIGV